MVSEGVQTNGFNRTTTSDQQTSPPNQNIPIRPLPQPQQPPLPPYKDPPPPPPLTSSQSPQKKHKPEVKQKPALPPFLAASQMQGYKLQVILKNIHRYVLIFAPQFGQIKASEGHYYSYLRSAEIKSLKT